MGSFSYGSILRRLEKVERSLEADDRDRMLDFVFFDAFNGGIFGHSHTMYWPGTRETRVVACSDEEELEMMRTNYEDSQHKFFGSGEVLSFPDFLEHFFYLSPNVPEDRKRAVVQKLRDDEKNVSSNSNCQNK